MSAPPVVPPELAPFHARWKIFAAKIRARVGEIEQEALGAYREVIALDVVEGTGVNGVSNALRARLIALRSKVSDSWSKLDNEMDDVECEDSAAARVLNATMLSEVAALGREIERLQETMIAYGEADAARALQAIAVEEAKTPLFCGQCGATLARPPIGVTANVPCGSCRAVTTATPGTAGMMFTKGAGAIALAFEAALPMWYARQDAETAWHRLRYKTIDDLMRWEAANRAYWQRFAETMAAYLPGWTAQTVADEVRGKMSQFELHEMKDDRTVRENLQAGFAAVGTNDAAQVQAWLARQRDSDTARDELVEAFVERGWHDHARWIAQITGYDADTFVELQQEVALRGD